MDQDVTVQLSARGGSVEAHSGVIMEGTTNNVLYLLMGYVREGDLVTLRTPSGTTIKVRVEQSITLPE